MSRPLALSVAAGALALLACLPLMLDLYWVNMIALAFIYSIGVYSITMLTGFTGLLSFGQAGFVGLGAYTYGVMSVARYDPAVAALCGLALPTFVGLLLALPAARLKGHYMAIGTLGFGVLIAQLLTNLVDVTRGPMGLLGIRPIGLDRVGWFYVALAVSLGLLAALTYIDRRSYLGVLLKSVKYDEISARSSGVGVFALKLVAFSSSAFLAGLCGVMLAAYMRFLTPDLFLPAESFRLLMMSVVGGVGSAAGAFVASLILNLVPEALRALGETNLRLLVYGVMVLFVLWFVPGGIGALLDRWFRSRPSRTSEADLTQLTASQGRTAGTLAP